MELTLRGATDTAHPQPIVPIYRIHSINQPFCDRSSCWCQAGKARITPLLTAIQHGELLLAEAVSLATESAE